MAPDVAMSVPIDTASAVTGSAEVGLDWVANPAGPSACAVAVTSYWADENATGTA
jgi:hypothetical protein